MKGKWSNKKVLLHICCAPCSIYVLGRLREERAGVSAYFYNPNIHPYTEFLKRITTLTNYAGIMLLPLTLDMGYDLEDFLKGAIAQGPPVPILLPHEARKDVLKGVEAGADAVTTTLLHSKHQRHEDIRAIAEESSEKHGIPFLYEDFR